jgi:N-acetylated-alpha-linked acidic dipeptidase
LHAAAAHDLLLGQASPEKLQHLNTQLLQVEANWLDPAGIPGRPWFRHLLYSSRYTYAHLEFPGLTEAVEKQDWKLASQQAALLEQAVQKNTDLLRSARTSWEKNNP